MRNFKNLQVWQLSHQMTLEIYRITKRFPSNERYEIVRQMKRCAHSIPANISEGCGRKSDKDFNRFLQIALGSAHELEYFILLSKDLNLIDYATYSILDENINTLKKRIYTLSQKLIT